MEKNETYLKQKPSKRKRMLNKLSKIYSQFKPDMNHSAMKKKGKLCLKVNKGQDQLE